MRRQGPVKFLARSDLRPGGPDARIRHPGDTSESIELPRTMEGTERYW